MGREERRKKARAVQGMVENGGGGTECFVEIEDEAFLYFFAISLHYNGVGGREHETGGTPLQSI